MPLGIVLKVKASPGKFKKRLLESKVAYSSQLRSQGSKATKVTPFTDLKTVALKGREARVH